MPKATAVRKVLVSVSQSNLKKTATRVLNGQSLVSTEIDYILRTVGPRATQQDLDAVVMNVRKLPWASIMLPE